MGHFLDYSSLHDSEWSHPWVESWDLGSEDWEMRNEE